MTFVRTFIVTAFLLFITFSAPVLAEEYYGDGPLGAMTPKYEKLSHKNGLFASMKTMDYYFLEPENPDPDLLYPLVVTLHGTAGNSYAGFYLAQSKMRDYYPAYVIAPMIAQNQRWAFPRKRKDKEMTMPYVVSLVKDLEEEYPIDPDRIYIIGCSSGGYGVFGALIKYPDIFTAGVAISGSWDTKDAEKLAKTKLRIFHGAHDDIIPVDGTRALAEAIDEAGGAINYTELQSYGHSCSSEAFYPEYMWDWLFFQTKDL